MNQEPTSKLETDFFPDLQRFKSREEGRAALKELSMKAFRGTWWLLPVIWTGHSFWLGSVRKWLMISGGLAEIMFLGVLFVVFRHKVYKPVRHWIRRGLRIKLNGQGVSLCVECSHDLSGQPDASCSECSATTHISCTADADSALGPVPCKLNLSQLRLPSGIPKVDPAELTNRRRAAKINLAGAGLLSLLFFMPWLDVSCQNQTVSRPSGFNLATGVFDSTLQNTLGMLQASEGWAAAQSGGSDSDSALLPEMERKMAEARRDYFPATRLAAVVHALALLALIGLGAWQFKQSPTDNRPASQSLSLRDAQFAAIFSAVAIMSLWACRILVEKDMGGGDRQMGASRFDLTPWFWTAIWANAALLLATSVVWLSARKTVAQAATDSPCAAGCETAARSAPPPVPCAEIAVEAQSPNPAQRPEEPATTTLDSPTPTAEASAHPEPTTASTKSDWGMGQMFGAFAIALCLAAIASFVLLKPGPDQALGDDLQAKYKLRTALQQRSNAAKPMLTQEQLRSVFGR